jgi:hypothetical protein
MSALEKVSTENRRSRRHLIIKVGAIAGTAALAMLTTPRRAAADDGGGDDGRRRCFLKGTIIRTANGDRKVEDLSVGDLLPTVFGGLSPIQWIGRYSVKKSDSIKAWVKDVLPVRVARSALGPDMPHADLYVTKAHALFIDGVLVTAASLINGTTITLYDARENNELEFFHIKLERHNVIYAEGVPCETLLNIRESTVNSAEYLRRYEPPTTQEAPCAPLLGFNGARSEIKSHFRSAISPWVDRRQKLDIIRDKLEERGIAVLRDRSASRDCRVSA